MLSFITPVSNISTASFFRSLLQSRRHNRQKNLVVKLSPNKARFCSNLERNDQSSEPRCHP